MSHSPLHQRLHLRLAMRQSFSSLTFSPLPPYPTGSSTREPSELPTTTPLSLESISFEPREVVQETGNMRATHIRPHTAPASPDRPGTAYSTRSTIRQVEPSPDSLIADVADDPLSGPGLSFEPFPPFDLSKSGDTVASHELYTHVHSTGPTTGTEAETGALRRGGTPSGRTSPQKSRSCSPRKSRSQSPRKHMVRTPTLPAHQESPSSSYSAIDSEKWDAPDTPSPIPPEQQRDVYAPLRVHRPFMEPGSEREPVVHHGTHTRIADYMRKLQTQPGCAPVSAIEGERENSQRTEPVKKVVAPIPHIIQAMAQPSNAFETLSPYSAARREAAGEKEPARHTSASRRSETSGTSVASRHSIFSTPGRDEMERKKPIVEEDEGPFAKAANMQDLEQRRRTVSEGTKVSEENDGKKRFCGLRCAVM
ncbi:hypothetical protein OPT61_g1290 [Boeremia exigua]|uniref:Uncharacterized protein n=1 Tax=Boeremia exigua TaxID=749465 RepID=A0ACC2IQQ7_9PLEO|nr:hypothetical protein OPT61_g1290 [Boeremia exigua]